MSETTPTPAPARSGAMLGVFAVAMSLMALALAGVTLEKARNQTITAQSDNAAGAKMLATQQQQITDLKNALDNAKQSINALNTNLASQASNGQQQIQQSLDATKQDLQNQQNALVQDIAKLDDKLASLGAPGQQAEAQLAYLSLRDKVNSGEPYAKELARLRAAMGDAVSKDAFAVLEKHQDEGIKTLAQLYSDLNSATFASGEEAVSQPVSAKDGPWWKQSLAKLRGLVKIERIGEDSSPFETLDEVQSLSKLGDVKATREAILRLPEGDQVPFEQWLDDADARLKVLAALDAITPQTPAPVKHEAPTPPPAPKPAPVVAAPAPKPEPAPAAPAPEPKPAAPVLD